MNHPQIVLNSACTPDGTVLISHHRHDYIEHDDACGSRYFIDGGNSYQRHGCVGVAAFKGLTDLCVYSDAPHAKLRKACHWGTRGKNGDEPLHYVRVMDMETDHLQKVVGQYGETADTTKIKIMKDELDLREVGALQIQALRNE